MEYIKEALDAIRANGLYPNIERPSQAEKDAFTVFSSNDYLGMAAGTRFRHLAHEAIDTYGVGTGNCWVLSGDSQIQHGLEDAIAEYVGGEAALTFSAGYLANVGTLTAITNVYTPKGISSRVRFLPIPRSTVVICDDLCHASIFDGMVMTRAKLVRYRHCNMESLQSKLEQFKDCRKLVVTDGVFSMDGDIAPLPEIVDLARQYDAMVMVDDAHGSGVLGENGRGTLEHFGLTLDDIDILTGTFSKALGGPGGFVVAKKDLIDYLRISARSFIFSSALPEVISVSLTAHLKELMVNAQMRDNLWTLTHHLHSNLRKLGFDIMNTQTPITPILIGCEQKTKALVAGLYQHKIIAPCVHYPAVPWGKARIRLTVRGDHTMQDIEKLIEVMATVGRELEIIEDRSKQSMAVSGDYSVSTVSS
jgi:8-amino-7-oxononanoate synthase